MSDYRDNELDSIDNELDSIDNDTYLYSTNELLLEKLNVSLDKAIEFEEYEKAHLNEATRLAGLEEEMIHLAEMSQNANADELINIADRLKIIEEELNQITAYDEFVPEGEWNLDAEDVDMEDLLERRPVFSTLNPVVILLPDGEEE